MKNRHLALLLAAILLPAPPSRGAGSLELKYVVIVSRHGVRAPTWENARLNEHAAEPWPEWDVPPGNLTRHGRKLIELMGAYYRDWLSAEGLLGAAGCRDAQRIYIYADKDQRTVETGRAFADSLAPGCGVEVHSATPGQPDPLFSGLRAPEPERMVAAVRERLGADPQELVAGHRAAFEDLHAILRDKPGPPVPIGVALKGNSAELTGPFAMGSTFSENLLLEYTNGMEGSALGWGRLTRENLQRVLEIHAVYADLMRRTPYLARARGSNLLAHVERSLEQAATGKTAPGALGGPGNTVLLISGHDTNLSNLSGMLGLTWKLPGYQVDDTPPGGALIFSLWRDGVTGKYSVKLRYVAQALDQMRHAERLSMASPPEFQDLTLPGCPVESCSWEAARAVIEKAIDPEFITGTGKRKE